MIRLSLTLLILLWIGQSTASAEPSGWSRTCVFKSGPLAGQSQFFANYPPAPVGSFCSDGIANSGFVTPEGSTCNFQTGIFAGHKVSYRWLGYLLPVGAGCQDGMGGVGQVEDAPGEQDFSQTCRYMVGPKSGTRESFPNLKPARVGINCWDGVSSHGVVYISSPGVAANGWNGDPKTTPAPDPSAPLVGPGGAAEAQKTPLYSVMKCVAASGGSEEAAAACVAKDMPRDAVEQCARDCGACFGKWDTNFYACKAVIGGAKILGIDLGGAAKAADAAWGAAVDGGKVVLDAGKEVGSAAVGTAKTIVKTIDKLNPF